MVAMTSNAEAELKSPGFTAAEDEARLSAREGGIPIGAALVAADGVKVLGRGHNVRVQKGSCTGHVSLKCSSAAFPLRF